MKDKNNPTGSREFSKKKKYFFLATKKYFPPEELEIFLRGIFFCAKM